MNFNDLPKINSEKTFSQKYNFRKLKSFHLILKEIGLDCSTFYDEVLLNELEDDICEECFKNEGENASNKTKSDRMISEPRI